eukprot:TRINITY_DN5738_c0_g1_i3.p1 TRINITY_DN5738_c0_g1~~TRINITY_DN5738_c0_g1_i3.p1  ORF type:complete len:174 (-),score=95.79 TRINITY_DN5738_c0_g1_i3:55-576(-)
MMTTMMKADMLIVIEGTVINSELQDFKFNKKKGGEYDWDDALYSEELPLIMNHLHQYVDVDKTNKMKQPTAAEKKSAPSSKHADNGDDVKGKRKKKEEVKEEVKGKGRAIAEPKEVAPPASKKIKATTAVKEDRGTTRGKRRSSSSSSSTSSSSSSSLSSSSSSSSASTKNKK